MSSRLISFFIFNAAFFAFAMEASAEYVAHCEDESYSYRFSLVTQGKGQVVGNLWTEDRVEEFKSYSLQRESRQPSHCEFSANAVTVDGSEMTMMIDKDENSETGFVGHLQENLVVDVSDKQFTCFVSRFAQDQVCGKPLSLRKLSSEPQIKKKQAKKH